MVEELVKVYTDINLDWDNYVSTNKISIINLRRYQVRHIDDNILDNLIFEYHKFVTNNYIRICSMITHTIDGNRIKAINSISDKIRRYKESEQQGKSDIIKCLNDIYGVRIYTRDDFDYDEIINYLKNSHIKDKIRIFHSMKSDYNATHVYLKIDNYHFPWELQIWRKKDKDKNEESHFKYKQRYTKWEQED